MTQSSTAATLQANIPQIQTVKRKARKSVVRSKKIDLIEAAYALLTQNSPQNLSIRTVASAAGCTTGAVYRHFDSLDHLFLVASIRFLEDYMEDLNGLLLKDEDPLRQHIEMWRSFGRQAFANIDVFEMMFWNVDGDVLNDAIFAYYQEFPERWRKLSGFQVMVFFGSDIHERNLLTLNRCMAEYKLKASTIGIVNDLEILSFHGLMMEYKNCYRIPGKAEEALNRYMKMLDQMLELLIAAVQ